jgi:uncharacterized protein YjaZ
MDGKLYHSLLLEGHYSNMTSEGLAQSFITEAVACNCISIWNQYYNEHRT